MEKKFDLQVINPVTKEEIYNVSIKSLIEVNPEQIVSKFKITTNGDEKGGHIVEITACNKELRNVLAVRIAEELTENAFYSAFNEYNSSDITLLEMGVDCEKRFGVNIDDIKANIRYQVLEGLGVFE